MELRRHGIKGKKKLAAQIDAYYRLWQVASTEDKPALLERIRDVVAVTYEARFHDMASIGDRQFKQDATSYMRAALLMDRLGLDTRIYREEIRKVHRRFNGHMRKRGPHQRLVFHWYYQHFELEEPFPLGDALQRGYIARRADPTTFSDRDAYQVTHEIFVPYEYGERLDADPFDAGDKRYLREALPLLVRRYIYEDDPDLVAELISCIRFLQFVELPAYRDGLLYLLDSQHPDGSWGNWERARKGFGEYAAQGRILHTTVVNIDALTVAFYKRWNRGLFPGCGDS